MRDFIFKFRLKNKLDGEILIQQVNLYNDKNGLMQYPMDLKIWEVLSINEWSGLKDIKGNRIFENDIMEDENGYYGKVWFNKETAFWLFDDENDVTFDLGELSRHGEVIGDIYSKSNLLKRY